RLPHRHRRRRGRGDVRGAPLLDGLSPTVTPPPDALLQETRAPMARRSLKPQLNQIRAWVQQGRTDAWIAHQLEISAGELREFRKQYDLSPDEDGPGSNEIDLRDEIEAEIEAATEAEEAEKAERAEDGESESETEGDEDEDREDRAEGGSGAGRRRRRRRGRRGGRGRRKELEASFD